MNIGILTLFHENYNWGGTLQGFALKTYLENTFPDVKVDIIQYHSDTNIVYKNKLQQAMQYDAVDILRRIIKGITNRIISSDGFDLSGRYALFDEFMSCYRTNPEIYDDTNFESISDKYDVLISGSDQVWNPNVARPGYFFKGVSESCNTVAYAVSIARDSLTKHERNIMVPLIKKIDYISVREKTARLFLQEYIGKDKIVYENIDPAMLISKIEWRAFCKDIPEHKNKFALAFFFSDSIEYRSKISEICKRKGIDLFYIPMASQYIKNDKLGPGKPLIDVGPREFVSLFRDAEYVFTDSFHGSIFSIIFNKKFNVFERDKHNSVSKNSRLYDLLDKFELSDRMITNVETEQIEDAFDEEIDYQIVNCKIQEYQDSAKKFLYDAIYQKNKC